jgi:hypothetical protein
VHAGLLGYGLDRRRVEAALDQQLAGRREGPFADARVTRAARVTARLCHGSDRSDQAGIRRRWRWLGYF